MDATRPEKYHYGVLYTGRVSFTHQCKIAWVIPKGELGYALSAVFGAAPDVL